MKSHPQLWSLQDNQGSDCGHGNLWSILRNAMLGLVIDRLGSISTSIMESTDKTGSGVIHSLIHELTTAISTDIKQRSNGVTCSPRDELTTAISTNIKQRNNGVTCSPRDELAIASSTDVMVVSSAHQEMNSPLLSALTQCCHPLTKRWTHHCNQHWHGGVICRQRLTHHSYRNHTQHTETSRQTVVSHLQAEIDSS